MTYQEKAIELCEAKDANGIFKFLDKVEYPDHLPLVVSVGLASLKAHQFAWNALEDWKNNDEPTWLLELKS